jgi:nitrate reductase gamma subunit
MIVPPIRAGDGHEYALILEGFFNHLSPNIQVSDVERLIYLIQKFPNYNYDTNALEQIIDSIKTGAYQTPLGIYKSHDGQYFGYHFWFYSLVNLPVKALLAGLKLNELKAFQLTNALLMVVCVTYTLLISRQHYVTRFIIALLYLAGCNFLYFLWTHPELYTATVLTIASCAFLDRRYRLAVIMIALAGLQNPSAIFFIPLVIITSLIGYGVSPFRWLKKAVASYLVQLGLIGSIGLIPYGFYYYHFGVFSLITEEGYIDSSLIGPERLMSALFDFNQGMIVGFPGIMLTIGGLWMLYIWRAVVSKTRLTFNRADVLLLATLVMLITMLGQKNWNHGQAVFNRYTFWTAMPLLAWVGVNLKTLRPAIRSLVLISILILQLIPHGLFVYQPKSSYLRMKPYMKWVLEKLPGFYQPEPEIFAERVQGYEAGNKINPNYAYTAPYVYKNEKGEILQVLLSKQSISKTTEQICGSSGKLVDNNTNQPVDLSKVRFDKRGWSYLFGRFRCYFDHGRVRSPK